MRLQQLQGILEVEKHRSVSAAARAMYMGQTTLSASIRKLEEALGVTIFERRSNGVEPTAEGKQILELASRICWNYAQLREIGQKKSDSSRVTIYVSPGVEAFLPGVLEERLPPQEPPLLLRFQKERTAEISQYIMNNKCDIAVSHIGGTRLELMKKILDKYDMQIEPLAVDHLFLVVRPDHPLAGRTQMAVQEIQNLEIAGLQHYRESAGSLVFEPRMGYTNRYTTLPNVRLILQAVEEQNMAAILTGCSFDYENSRKGKRFHPVYLTDPERGNEIMLYLMFRRAWAQTHAGKLLLECIRQFFSELPFDPYFGVQKSVSSQEKILENDWIRNGKD